MAKKEVKTNKKENSKNKKSFSKDFKAELKKVVWPTPKQLVNNTVAVITIVLITAIIVFALDLVFETLNKQGVEKVKEVITESNTTNESEDKSTEQNESDQKEAETSDENTDAPETEQNNVDSQAENVE